MVSFVPTADCPSCIKVVSVRTTGDREIRRLGVDVCSCRHMSAMDVGAVNAPTQAVTTIGLDIAKSVFQVQGIDAEAAYSSAVS